MLGFFFIHALGCPGLQVCPILQSDTWTTTTLQGYVTECFPNIGDCLVSCDPFKNYFKIVLNVCTY